MAPTRLARLLELLYDGGGTFQINATDHHDRIAAAVGRNAFLDRCLQDDFNSDVLPGKDQLQVHTVSVEAGINRDAIVQ